MISKHEKKKRGFVVNSCERRFLEVTSTTNYFKQRVSLLMIKQFPPIHLILKKILMFKFDNFKFQNQFKQNKNKNVGIIFLIAFEYFY